MVLILFTDENLWSLGDSKKKREKLETNLLLKTLNAHQCNLILPRENLCMSN